jgi:nucleoside-diphosphate-sugar epimerase
LVISCAPQQSLRQSERECLDTCPLNNALASAAFNTHSGRLTHTFPLERLAAAPALGRTARAAAAAAASARAAVKIKHFDPKAHDFGKKKAFPMRPQHFYTSVAKAMTDLDWAPQFNSEDGLRDSYENDFVHKKVSYISTIYTCE